MTWFPIRRAKETIEELTRAVMAAREKTDASEDDLRSQIATSKNELEKVPIAGAIIWKGGRHE